AGETLAALQGKLAGHRRTGAQWISTWVEHHADDHELPRRFAPWIEREQRLRETAPRKTSREVVGQLMRLQIQWLRRAGREASAMALMQRLLDLEQGRRAELRELLVWLIEQEHWATVDDVRRRFRDRIQGSSKLLYLVAEARQKQGDSQQAEETARRAYRLRPGIAAQADQRARLAMWLWNRGQIEWAIREFDDVFEHSEPAFAQRYAELLYDQRRYGRAAEVLETLIADWQGGIGGRRGGTGHAQPLRARAHYFRACHHRQQGELQKQKHQLDEALEDDPQELDTLIARYRLPDPPEAYRRQTLAMIRRAAEQLEREIEQSPDAASAYNQYAWLIGNTEGDLAKALRYSRRSLKLRPDTAGYLDTLAHVHFARGEYAEAVEQQSRAARLQPHSKLITDQLDVFRAAAAEHRKEQGHAEE
ncbi:MAG: hypothetical protein ACOC46_03280, partial [Pirellulales bacterium]